MKRFFSLLLALLMMTCAARADIVGRAGEDYIHQWIAPNGQALYFVSPEVEPYVHMEDVNFDGIEDVVALTFRGASNFGAEFFVWDGMAYVPVTHAGADSLVNHSLYPELGLVETCVQESWALHTRQLWRWKGTELELVRTAYSSEVSTMTVEDRITTVVTDDNFVRLRVWDNLNLSTENGVTGSTLLMDTVVPLHDSEALLAADKEEHRVFWDGLLP